MAVHDHNSGRTDTTKYISEISQCQTILEEARSILQLEPADSTEKKWVMMEEKETRRLEEIMEESKEMKCDVTERISNDAKISSVGQEALLCSGEDSDESCKR